MGFSGYYCRAAGFGIQRLSSPDENQKDFYLMYEIFWRNGRLKFYADWLNRCWQYKSCIL